MRRLLLHQASGAAGDALVALALAGSLFFSVPETTARGRVLLYLGLTMAPFAVVSPLLARILDRFKGSLRWAMVLTSIGRAGLAWLLSTRLDTLLLFPLAFGILVFSRAALVVRGAMLPHVVPEGAALVDANSSMSRISAIAGMAAGVPGLLLIKWPGVHFELLVGAAVYYLGTIPSLRLPASTGTRASKQRARARQAAASPMVRQAIIATAGMRFLVGFLVFHLAFALRRENLGSIGLALLVGSSAFGGLAGAILAPRLRRGLKETGIIATSLVAAGIAGLVVGRWFSLYTAAVLVFVFGIASGTAKVAFDSIIQSELPEGARGWAFARSESVLQLAWVGGAIAPLVIPIPSGPGVFIAGVTAQVLAIIYVAGRRRAASGTALP